MFEVRQLRAGDAEALLALNQTLDRETAFMLLEPDERSGDIERQRQAVERILAASAHQAMFVADAGERLAGLLVITGGMFRRNRRTASIVVGVAQDFWRRGVGNGLFAAAEAWAAERGIRRLELSVMAHNRGAIALYERRGFTVEGTRRAAVEIGGEVHDELYMGKLLESAR